jgi:hypothetical protein
MIGGARPRDAGLVRADPYDCSVQAVEQPVVDLVEMTSGQREMPVVVGELSFNARDVAREPLPVAKRNEPVLAAVA